MMSTENRKLVEEVYRRFMDGEEHAGWDELDDQMVYLEWLDDDQMVRECDALISLQRKGDIRCSQEFCNQGCYAVKVVDAAQAIVDLYKETGNLHKNNRYVLGNYLALSQLKQIVSITK